MYSSCSCNQPTLSSTVKAGKGYREQTTPLDAAAFLRALAAAWAPNALRTDQWRSGEFTVTMWQIAFVASKIEKRLRDPFSKANVGDSDSNRLADTYQNLCAECEAFGWSRIKIPHVIGKNVALA
jgi:hypothetical protein